MEGTAESGSDRVESIPRFGLRKKGLDKTPYGKVRQLVGLPDHLLEGNTAPRSRRHLFNVIPDV